MALLLMGWFIFSNTSASEFKPYFGVKLGLGKSTLSSSADVSNLTKKGYTINSYKRDSESDSSNSFGFSYAISPKIAIDIHLLNLGDVQSSLDIELPEGVSTEQAAKDIVKASPQQAGGTLLTLGGNYIHPINQKVDIRAGAGYLIGSDSHRVTVNGETFEKIRNSTKAPYLKIGLGVKASKKVTITAQAERYFFDNTIDRYEIGLNYSFK